MAASFQRPHQISALVKNLKIYQVLGAYILFYLPSKKYKLIYLQTEKLYIVSLVVFIINLQSIQYFSILFFKKAAVQEFYIIFSKTYYMTASVLGYCVFSTLRIVVKLSAAVLLVKPIKTTVIEKTDFRVGYKCVFNNSARECDNLKNLFCRNYI